MKPKFKVGDQVIVKKTNGTFRHLSGNKGEVQSTYLDGMYRRWYRVKLKDSITIVASARELEFAEKLTPKFKVGDHVKSAEGFKGTVAKVELNKKYNTYVYIVNDAKICRIQGQYREDQLSLDNSIQKHVEKPKFKVGDYVETKDGRKVHIIAITDDSVMLKMDSGWTIYSDLENLKGAVNINNEYTDEQKFSVGTKVKYNGYNCTVVEHNYVHHNHLYDLQFEPIESCLMKPIFFSISESEIEEGWNKFQKFEPVKCIYQHSKYTYQIGIIQNVCGTCYKVMFKDGTTVSVPEKDLIKAPIDMKETKMTRLVELTHEKAKEWYKKGGELKEVALQAFKEEELKDNKPKSEKEYLDNYKFTGNECVIDIWMSNHKYADAIKALSKLLNIRQSWIGDWKPNFMMNLASNWAVKWYPNPGKWMIENHCCTNGGSLTFPSKETCEEFFECFKDLYEQAKILI